jgi:ATP-dependent Lon protease
MSRRPGVVGRKMDAESAGRAAPGSQAEAKPAPAPRELTHAELRFRVPPEQLGFTTTEEVPVGGDWFGQERALAALELGLRVRHAGYNIYVCGLAGTRREQILADLLRRFTGEQPTPGDRVLVQNFQNRDRPRALYLPAGWGARLRQDMRELTDELRRVLPKTFREETFEEEKERLAEQFGEQGEAINRQLGERATQAGFALHPGPGGEILFIPLKDGRPMEPKELEALSDAEQAALRRRQRELQREVKAVLRRQRSLLGRLGREVKAAERRIAEEIVTPLIEELAERYPQADVRRYLAEVREHILEHLSDFQESAASALPPFLLGGAGAADEDPRLDYEVNVLVDNSGNHGAPIITEPSPTYKNVFGAVERVVDRSGKLVTNFTRVTAGSLLRAHGGCLVVNIIDALSEPMVWRALKRALKAATLEIETYDPFALFATSALRPEAMQIDTRVVLTGPTDIFQLLYYYDEEFREIFKVRADFGFEAEGSEAQRNFVAQAARITKEEHLPPFDAAAVAALIEFAARAVGDRRKLPSQWNELGDLMREAAFWAARSHRGQVGAADVQQAIDQRSFRQNRIEAKIRELIRDRVLLVDVDGQRVGQVNGLAVMDIGGYDFGRPSRITAAVSMGSAGLIAVDREAKLSGHTYDKAVFIIGGYLRQTYAQDFPLSLSASLSFEQSYTGIEGDSASAAELCALISSLAGVPLRQDLAVTGSVNQFGEIQPIGGVNEKVEGFFYTCREIGLTGRQGVIVPVQNVDNLLPHRDVVEAVRDGKFHLYPIRTIDEGLEVLTGLKAGSVHEAGTIHHRAAQRLRELAEGLRKFAGGDKTAPAPPADES